MATRITASVVSACAGITFVAAACSSNNNSHGSSTKPTAFSAPHVVSGWSRVDLTPVSQPVVAGGTVVVYVSAGGGLQLVGLDPADGKTRWKVPASTGDVTPGVAPELTTDGTTVFYLDTAAGGTEVAALDAESGHRVWASRAGSFTSWPELCPGDPNDVCSVGSFSANGASLLRFVASSGHPLASAQISDSPSARELTPGLFDTGDRNPDTLAAASGSSVAWTRPLADIFSAPGESTDNGWNLDRINQIGLFVGSVGGPPTSETDQQAVLDLSKTMTAGFRIADGSPVWTDTGTTYLCSILPCPGATGTGSSGAGGGDSRGPQVALRVRATGSITETEGNLTPTVSPGMHAALEGFDPATGHTTWSLDITGDLGLVTQSKLPPRAGQTVLILPGAGGAPVEVDLTTGTQRPVPAGTIAWCQAPTSYKENPGYPAGNGQVIHDYTGDFAINPCDADQHQVPDPSQAPSFVGPAVGGLVVWSEADKIVAAPESQSA